MFLPPPEALSRAEPASPSPPSSGPGTRARTRPPTTSPPLSSPSPSCRRSTGADRQTLIRTDSAGGAHDFVSWLTRRGRWLSYSVGMTVTEVIHEHVLKVPASARTPAVETDGEIRDGAWVCELTGDVLDGRPKGMRLIIRKERPYPGAQLRITDTDGRGTPPPAIPPVLRGRTTRHHRPAPHPPPRPALALDRRDHRRTRTTCAPAQPRLTGNVHRPDDITRPGQWNPAPTRGDSRAAGLPTISSGKRKSPPRERILTSSLDEVGTPVHTMCAGWRAPLCSDTHKLVACAGGKWRTPRLVSPSVRRG